MLNQRHAVENASLYGRRVAPPDWALPLGGAPASELRGLEFGVPCWPSPLVTFLRGRNFLRPTQIVSFRQQSLYLDVSWMTGQGSSGASGDLVVNTTSTSRDCILPL